MNIKKNISDLPSVRNLLKIKIMLYDECGVKFKNYKIEHESKDYGACTFELNNFKVKYRNSKITPTKTGQFVTIWKRNEKGITEPFHHEDDFDFIIITAKNDDSIGQFIFPKNILIQQKIISTNNSGGKRGIRVYPPWDVVYSKQAEKTQNWQSAYFVYISHNESQNIEKAKLILGGIK